MNPAEFQFIACAEQTLWWYRGMNRMLLKLVQPYLRGRKVVRVFEAGCGTGHFAKSLQRDFGWNIFASDIAAEGLRFASLQGIKNLAQADVRFLPIKEGSFDVVISLDMLTHIPLGQETQVLRELARITAARGLLILRTSALDLLRSRHSEWVGESQRFTKRRLVKTARAAGFDILRCTYANSLLMPVALAKFRIWEPLTRQKPASGVTSTHPILNSALYMILNAETAMLQAGVNMPAGQSLLLIARRS